MKIEITVLGLNVIYVIAKWILVEETFLRCNKLLKYFLYI